MSATTLEALLLSWSTFLAGTGLFAVTRAKGRRAAALQCSSIDEHTRDAILIRPCAGFEMALERALLSTADARGIRDAKIVFAVPSVDDGAYPVARSVARDLAARGLDVEVRVTTDDGPNNKAMQLDAVLAKETSRAIAVVADSDVDLTDYPLATLLVPIRRELSVAAVWAPPFEDPPEPTWGDSISRALLGGSMHSFPILASLDARGLVGKLVSLRASSVVQMGGFRALRYVLGEDWELARRIRASGHRAEVAPVSVRALSGGRSVAAVLERMTRWLSVVRWQRPLVLLGYPLFFSATWIILVATLANGLSYIGLCTMTIALAGRLYVGRASARLVGIAPPSILFMAEADVALLIALVRTLFSRRVKWRNRELMLGARGALSET